jgi:hypothetical protein
MLAERVSNRSRHSLTFNSSRDIATSKLDKLYRAVLQDLDQLVDAIGLKAA